MLSSEGPELVFGLVAPIGTDTKLILATVESTLTVGYQSKVVRLSRLLDGVPGAPWGNKLRTTFEDERYRTYMDAGNELRQRLRRGDALAMLAIGAIREIRAETSGESTKPVPRCAYLLGSLKTPAEVESLRRIYGPAFVLLAAYSPRERRLQNLSRRIAESRNEFSSRICQPTAEGLISRDESEISVLHGQNVREAFHQADFFVEVSQSDGLRASATRIVELVFGNTFHTPTRDEYGMFHAHAAALRSSSLQRQVGAVVTTVEGDIISVGTNEVPKAGGGLYWCGDKPDHRDFTLGYESNDRLKRRMLADVFQRLKSHGWLEPEKSLKEVDELVKSALAGEDPPMKGAQVMNIIEFGRCVHAEMAALVDAARRGASVSGATLYSTTFPCHECARHIVAAGIRRVVYIEPYPKSLVPELYPDSIAVDHGESGESQLPFESFVGVAPRRYTDLFSMVERKEKDGTMKKWNASLARPRLGQYPSPRPIAYLSVEEQEFVEFVGQMASEGFAKSASGPTVAPAGS